VYDPFHNPQAALDRRDEVLRALLTNRDITLAQYQTALQSNALDLNPGRIYTRIKQPYFFSYVIDELQRQYGANTVREGGLKVYTTIDPRLQRLANKAIRDVLPLSLRSGVGDCLNRAGDRRNPCDDGCRAQRRQPVQPGRAVGAPGRLDLQGVRARVGDRAGRRPRFDLLHLGPVHLRQRTVVLRGLRERKAVVGAHLREHVLRVDLADACDARVRQHRLRAADTRRRPALRVADGAPPRRAPLA